MSNSPELFFDQVSEIENKLRGKNAIVFLDYDGTLTPIVATPDMAILSEDMRNSVRAVAEKFKTAIVSGRATDDVRKKVKIDGIFYAGSHGFEIHDPDNNVYINEEVKEASITLKKVFATLSDRLKDIEGALVEDVKYTVSVHYRLVSEDDFPVVEAAVQATIDKFSDFVITYGKKVFEIRPRIDWNKGKAVEWILNTLKFDVQNDIAIYIGDDVTDEDAFTALSSKGIGVLVADVDRETAAAYQVKNTEEVKKILDFLTDRIAI